MAKTKFHVKISGLEISFEGEREDLPKLSNAVGSQVQSLIQTPAALLEKASNGTHVPNGTIIDVPSHSNGTKKKGGSKAARNGTSTSRSVAQEPLLWKHDVERWGAPLQSWNPTKKAIWLLYVAKNETETSEMTPGLIASTFNHHFKESGSILVGNVSRDLKKASQDRPPTVQKNTTADGSPWYLTKQGINEAENLVKEARGTGEKAS